MLILSLVRQGVWVDLATQALSSGKCMVLHLEAYDLRGNLYTSYRIVRYADDRPVEMLG